MDLSGKNIFVTGGSGFVGNRLVETLIHDHGANVRALVHRAHAGALRLARLNVELVRGNITNTAEMAEAMAGCDIVIHLAYGSSGTPEQMRQITVEGTKAMIDAAVKNDVERFVNVSTGAVYFGSGDGMITETSPRSGWGWNYTEDKLDAENLIIRANDDQDFPGTTVHVGGIYGPWGGTFTKTPLLQLQEGVVVLVNDGDGLSNATYVDDVVQSLLLAATHPKAVGESFLITGPERVTRRQLYEAYEEMLGFSSTVGMTVDDIRKEKRNESISALKALPKESLKAAVGSQGIKDAVRSLPGSSMLQRFYAQNIAQKKQVAGAGGQTGTPDKKKIYPVEFMIPYYASRLEISSQKARDLLGYSPQYTLEQGMKLTEEWARWARIIPRHSS